MKRFLLSAWAILALALPASASEAAYNQYLVNAAQTSSQTFVLNLDAFRIDRISFGLVYSSGNPSVASFTDGNNSTNTLTVNSTSGLAGAQGQTSLIVKSTAAMASAQGTDIINVAASTGQLTSLLSATFTITVNGRVLVNTQNFNIVPTSASLSAINIANAITGANVGVTATATLASSSITLTCIVAGAACNTYGVSSSSTSAFVVQTASMTGGYDNPSFTLNGRQYQQGIDYTADVNYASNTIASMATAVNASSNTFGFTATAQGDFVTLVLNCTNIGSFCNSYTLTSSTPAALSVSSPTFMGGANASFIQFAGTTLTQGSTQGPGVWKVGASTIATAVNISSAVNNTPSLSGVVTSTDNGHGVITITASQAASTINYGVFASTPALVWGLTQFYGGAAPAYTPGASASIINVPAHGMATGLAVSFSTSSGVGLTPLAYGATYFIIATDPNDVQLALTSTGAFAGSFITLTSSTTTGGNTFKLIPVPLTSGMGLNWLASNDGVNWTAIGNSGGVAISSATIASPFASGTMNWDFGTIDYKFLELNFMGPTRGQENIAVYGYGKQTRF